LAEYAGLGVVEHIHIASEAGAALRALSEAHAVAGVGLQGDRYAAGKGFWSPDPGAVRDLTLIEAEVLEDLARNPGLAMAPGESRRNLTTRGVRLNDLVGRIFRVGEILCEGVRLCEPCRYLEQVTGRRLVRALLHRGGLRARLLSGGVIRVGDVVEQTVASPEAQTRDDHPSQRV
jgi:MOSC domain-containing protein YiiM